MMWGYGWDHGPMGWVMLLFWVLVVLGVVLVARALWQRETGTRDRETGRETDRALALLRERYARGEIQRDEFEQKRRDLGG